MVVALLSVVALVLLVWIAHVVMDLVNARRDYQFYTEVTRLREERRREEHDLAPERELEPERIN